jgi:glucosamine--fructose-6-phosphate aminotransferase (isomerizing)
MEVLSGLPDEPMTSLQFARYAADFLPQTGPKTNLVFGISVSGEVSRSYEALLMARQAGAHTIALTATPGSRVFSAADSVINTQSPPFIEPAGVVTPGVRSFFIHQLVLTLTALHLGEMRGHLSTEEAVLLRNELRNLDQALEQTITICEPLGQALASDWKDANEFVFVGGGPNYATALFNAAKMYEASGDTAAAQETEEWAHLQYFCKTANTPTFLITANQRDLSRVLEIAVAAKTIGRRVVGIAPTGSGALREITDRFLPFADGVREMFSPLVAAVPGELFAAYRAVELNEPFFRDFQGGRDREGGGGISRIRTSEIWQGEGK